jgi:hypothetical protein
MKKLLLFFILFLAIANVLQAQLYTKDSTLKISGSADIYYAYDFAQSKNYTPSADLLGTKQNSLDFGMLDFKLQKTIGKTSFFSDVYFGPRPESKGIAVKANYNIQNLYLSYQLNKKLSFSAGAMFRYQLFEKITPADNFSYSMSHSWQNTFNSYPRTGGLRASYVFSDKVSLNVGIYNSIDPQFSFDKVNGSFFYGTSDVVAQLFVTPIKDLQLSAACWQEAQKNNGRHLNLQARYQVNKGLKVGLDVTKVSGDTTSSLTAFTSSVLYVQQRINKIFTIGGRYEYMEQKESPNGTTVLSYLPGYYNTATITLNEKFGAVVLKQEIKLDQTNKANMASPFQDKDGNVTNKNTQLILAAVYSF